MSKAERFGLIVCACLFYLMIRFLIQCGESIQEIATTVDERVATLEAQVLELEVTCAKH